MLISVIDVDLRAWWVCQVFNLSTIWMFYHVRVAYIIMYNIIYDRIYIIHWVYENGYKYICDMTQGTFG